MDGEASRELNLGPLHRSILACKQNDPDLDNRGLDTILTAVGELIWITGEPGARPCKAWAAITDLVTGV